MLYATDFSVADYAFGIAGSFGSEIDVLHVVSRDDISKSELLAIMHQNLVGASRAQPGVSSEMFVESGEVRDRILEHVRER